jgi:hypothetical protein
MLLICTTSEQTLVYSELLHQGVVGQHWKNINAKKVWVLKNQKEELIFGYIYPGVFLIANRLI